MHSIVIGGVSRAGKTLLARRLKKRTGYAHFQFDHIITALAWAYPQLELSLGLPHDELIAKSAHFSSIIIGKLSCRSPQSYIFEATCFMPKKISEVARDAPVTGVFLGYSTVTPQKKLQDIRNYASQNPCYSDDLYDDELLALISENIDRSKSIEREAEEFGMKYYDLSPGFHLFDSIIDDIVKNIPNQPDADDGL